MREILMTLAIILMVIVAFAAACSFIFWLDCLFLSLKQRKPTRFLITLCLPPVGLWIEGRNRYRQWLKKNCLTPRMHLKTLYASVQTFWKSLDWRP